MPKIDYVGKDEMSNAVLNNTLRHKNKKTKPKTKGKKKKDCGCDA